MGVLTLWPDGNLEKDLAETHPPTAAFTELPSFVSLPDFRWLRQFIGVNPEHGFFFDVLRQGEFGQGFLSMIRAANAISPAGGGTHATMGDVLPSFVGAALILLCCVVLGAADSSRNKIQLLPLRVFAYSLLLPFLLLVVIFDTVSGSYRNSRASLPRLYRPPGFHLLHFAEFLFSKKVFHDVLEPTIVDFQEEYMEALREGRKWKSRWVLVRGYWSFFNATGLATIVGSVKKVVKIFGLVA